MSESSAAATYANALARLEDQRSSAQAFGVRANSQIWGATIANLGQMVAQYPEQQARMEQAKLRAEQTERERKKADDEAQVDASLRELFATGQTPSPSQLIAIAGPERGMKIASGIKGLTDMGDPVASYDTKMKALRDTMLGLHALSPELRKQWYPGIRQHAIDSKVITETDAPADYDEGWWQNTINYAKEPAKTTPKADYTLGNQRFSGETNEPVATGETKTGTAPNVGSFEDYVVRRFGPQPTAEQITQARKDYQQADDRPRITVNAGSDSTDAKAIADAIIRGEQPPELTGLYGNGAAVRAELARKGYNQATALTDWRATQKHVATLNGAQQTRMGQAIDNAAHSLDIIDDLANQWDGGKFPILNKAQLSAAKNGALGPKAQQIATKLEAQIADVTSELANVYMGGNSPTDHALDLASKNLAANWTRDQLKSAISMSRKNLQIRSNSMRNVGVAGASAGNAYEQKPATTPPAAAPASGLSYQDYLKAKGK